LVAVGSRIILIALMNMKHLKILVAGFMALLVAASLSGCATTYSTTSKGPTSFLAYEGKQQRWPRADSALVKSNFAVPAYQGPPSKSYQLLGFVVTSDSPISGMPSWIWGEETRLANACNQAKEQGADAIVVTMDPVIVKTFNAIPTPGGTSKRLLAESDAVVAAIKWVR
jgi:uncharacterized protein YceK